jgi:hypothetical protein
MSSGQGFGYSGNDYYGGVNIPEGLFISEKDFNLYE